MIIKKLDQVIEAVQSKPKKRLVVANAIDEHTIESVNEAKNLGLIEAVLVGDKGQIIQTCDQLEINPDKFTIIDVKDDVAAANEAVKIINRGEGDIIMKGTISTDKYLKAILNKEYGLVPPKGLLAHIAVIENPNYHKLLVVSDVAIIPHPDLRQKITIVNYLINSARKLGIEQPKVALVAATEQVTDAVPSTIDAAIIAKMADRGQIKGAIVDGPMGFDLAVDQDSVHIKRFKSPVAGDADCILFPNIEAGNVFYKTNAKLAGGQSGAIVAGAKVPIVLTSRGDSPKTKMYSIALGALLA